MASLTATPCFPLGSLQLPATDSVKSMSALLNLPSDVLFCILSRLSATDLCQAAACCKYLSELAIDEDLWAPLFDSKWGKFFQSKGYSSLAYNNPGSRGGPRIPYWLHSQLEQTCFCHSSSEDHFTQARLSHSSSSTHIAALYESFLQALDQDGSGFDFLFEDPPKPQPGATCPLHAWRGHIPRTDVRPLSSMRLYALLEEGKLHFPVQIFNCEQYLGCLLSGYDALARSVGTKIVSGRSIKLYDVQYAGPVYHEILEVPLILQESDVEWERLRPTPSTLAPCQLYKGDDILQLTVGDFVEVQWRMHEEMPYTWFFGQVRHYLFCQKACSMDVPIPACADCVCNQMGRVCITFRKFGFEYVERSLFLDKEMPAEHRMAQGVGFEGGTFGGLRVIRDPAQLAAWMDYGQTQQKLLGSKSIC